MFSLPLTLLLSAVLPCLCSAQTAERPAEIETEISKTGRFASLDINRDGWDDLWLHLFPEVDPVQPGLDPDHDGKSNYEEMLNFTDPNGAAIDVMKITPAERLEARRAAAAARRMGDSQKRERFQAFLKSHDVMGTTKTRQESSVANAEARMAAAAAAYGDGLAKIGGIGNKTVDPAEATVIEAVDPAEAKIIAFERLSNNQILLAWEGEPGRAYYVEWSDDLIEWTGELESIALIAGVGTWGQIAESPRRFYRLRADSYVSDIIGDPTGGDGITTYGATVAWNNSYVTVQTHLPDGMEPIVKIFVDGIYYGNAVKSQETTYVAQVAYSSISAGSHTLHAEISLFSNTTPGPDNPDYTPTSIRLRTPGVGINTSQTALHGIGATEEHINSGEPGSPTSTIIHVDYPLITNNGAPMEDIMYTFVVTDENGNIVRQSDGVEAGPGPGRITYPWDGRGEEGISLPDGPYYVDFFMSVPGSIEFGQPVMIKNGPAKLKILALGETSELKTGWGAAEISAYRPAWWQAMDSSGGSVGSAWGPWVALGGGPEAVIGGLQKGIGKSPHGQVSFWLPYNKNSVQTWGNGSPAVSAANGTAFNNYDMGFLIGHGVASSGGTYTNAANQQITLPPQHYFPFINNRTTGETVWIKSGQMPKFGAGKLKWMYTVTCNYFREASHNPGNNHDIYSAMKTAGTLPIGPNLHILGGYTTSCDVDGAMGGAFSTAAMQQNAETEHATLVAAWTYAWKYSLNSKNRDGKNKLKQVRNARSVYWPECKNDTLPGAPYPSLTNPNGNADQTRLEKTDSKYP